jgi:hypothetical protein
MHLGLKLPFSDFTDVASTNPLKRRDLADKIRDACVNGKS